MILNFSVRNFKSFKEKQEFSFIKTSIKNDELKDNYVTINKDLDVLKSSLIYGRNASGKTNFLQAIDTFIDIVHSSTDLKLNESIPHYIPFLFDKTSRNKPTFFSLDFLVNSTKYEYKIEFDSNYILSESLTYYPKGYPANLFSRKKDDEINFGSQLKGEKKSIENQLLDNQLFLSKAANSNHDQLKIPYLFITDSINPSFPSDNFAFSKIVMSNFKKILFDEQETVFSNNLNSLIRVADTGIQGIEAEENLDVDTKLSEKISNSTLRESFENDLKFQLNAVHKLFQDENEIGKEYLDFEEESAGTKKLAAVGGAAILSLMQGKTFIIDELDNSLHPRLTKFIVSLFHSSKHNKKNAQLLFATHDVSLLSAKLFRRDQIWFAEKDKTGATEIYSLADFEGVRNKTPLEKWYLSGKFGATPVINELELDLIFEGPNEEKKKN